MCYTDASPQPPSHGGAPAGDSVYIMAGMRVLLDVSPPELVVVLLEGELVFDPQVGRQRGARWAGRARRGNALPVVAMSTPAGVCTCVELCA
jgi:hypothetical protein